MAVDLNNGQIEDTGPDSYENLLEDYSHFAPPKASFPSSSSAIPTATLPCSAATPSTS